MSCSPSREESQSLQSQVWVFRAEHASSDAQNILGESLVALDIMEITLMKPNIVLLNRSWDRAGRSVKRSRRRVPALCVDLWPMKGPDLRRSNPGLVF